MLDIDISDSKNNNDQIDRSSEMSPNIEFPSERRTVLKDEQSANFEGCAEKNPIADEERNLKGDKEKSVEGGEEKNLEGDEEKSLEGDREKSLRGDEETHFDGDGKKILKTTKKKI